LKERFLDPNPTTFSAITFEDSFDKVIHIETKDYGGVMYLANQAHYPHHVLECGVIGNKNYMYAMTTTIHALGEMYWDYRGATDNIHDPLIKIPCACGCGRPLIAFMSSL
jgi:hypothetical protein